MSENKSINNSEIQNEECADILKTKFPKVKKILLECFPKDVIKDMLNKTELDLMRGDKRRFKIFEKASELLEIARDDFKHINELKRMYYSVADDAAERYMNYFFLADSYYGSLFVDVLGNDEIASIRKYNLNLSLQEMNDIRDKYAKKAANAKLIAAENRKKNSLFDKIHKSALEDAKKIGNNLDVLLGDESSEKGKTQKGSQKD